MEILHLTLKKKWFDLIASGKKTDEYREFKPHWENRLIDNADNGRKFDIVRFKNGYAADSPTMDVEFREIVFSGRQWITPKNGEELTDSTIVIRLGNVLSVTGEGR